MAFHVPGVRSAQRCVPWYFHAWQGHPQLGGGVRLVAPKLHAEVGVAGRALRHPLDPGFGQQPLTVHDPVVAQQLAHLEPVAPVGNQATEGLGVASGTIQLHPRFAGPDGLPKPVTQQLRPGPPGGAFDRDGKRLHTGVRPDVLGARLGRKGSAKRFARQVPGKKQARSGCKRADGEPPALQAALHVRQVRQCEGGALRIGCPLLQPEGRRLVHGFDHAVVDGSAQHYRREALVQGLRIKRGAHVGPAVIALELQLAIDRNQERVGLLALRVLPGRFQRIDRNDRRLRKGRRPAFPVSDRRQRRERLRVGRVGSLLRPCQEPNPEPIVVRHPAQ